MAHPFVRTTTTTWARIVTATMVVTLSCWPLSTAQAQQLIPGLTGAQCSAAGGQIRTWTNTAGRGTPVGECYVPPRTGGGGGTGTAGAGTAANNAAAAIGVIGGVLGIIEGLQQLSPPSSTGEGASSPAPTVQRREAPSPAASGDRKCRAPADGPVPTTCDCPAGTRRLVTDRRCGGRGEGNQATGKSDCVLTYACVASGTKTPMPVKSRTDGAICVGNAARKIEVTTEPSGFQIFARLKNTTDCAICYTISDCEPDPTSANLPLVCKDKPGRVGARSVDVNWFNKKPDIKSEKYCK